MDYLTALNSLVSKINADYVNYSTKYGVEEITDNIQNRINKFKESVTIIEGKKYTKIVTGSSVWGFVVSVDNDKKFKKGDILKAAGYATPARNHARGNILTNDYSVAWNGPHYLK